MDSGGCRAPSLFRKGYERGMFPAAIVRRQINRESCLIALIDFSRIYTKARQGRKGHERGLSGTPSGRCGQSVWYNELTRTLTPRFTQFECHVVNVDDKMQSATHHPPTIQPLDPPSRPIFLCSGHGRHVTSFWPDGWPSPSFSFCFCSRNSNPPASPPSHPLPTKHTWPTRF